MNILVVAECINKNKTSEGICTTNFLNALGRSSHTTDCLYMQMLQHEVDNPEWIDQRVNLLKIPNGFIDRLVYRSRLVRKICSRFLGINLLRERRSSRFAKNLRKLLKNKSYDLVISRTIAGSLASPKAGLKERKLLNGKWLVNFNDPVPITMMPYPYFKGKVQFPRLTRNDEQLVQRIVAAADFISSPSELLTRHILDFTKENRKPSVTLPHIYVDAEVSDKETFLNPEKFNIVHAGSLLKERNPQYLLEAYNRFLTEYPEVIKDVVLTFFGNIHSSHLERFENLKYPENVFLFNKRIPHDEALAVLKNSDVLIILEAISDFSPFMPGKLAEYIGMNRVIWSLSPENSETRRILGHEYPFQNEADDVEGMVASLREMYALWLNKGDQMGLNRDDLTHYISDQHVSESMVELVKPS